MIFDYLKKIFGWVDEGSKKRKVSEDSSFEEEYITPKKFKPSCNMTRTREQYFTIDDSDDDDIVCLDEQKCSSIKPCTQMNGTHKKQPQSYEVYKAMSPNCKSTCSSLHHNKLSKEHFFHHKHRMPDSCHTSPTLSKTNQLKERYQYEVMLQNLFPNRIQILNRRADYTPVRKSSVEVIDLEKSEMLTSNCKMHSSSANMSQMIPTYRRGSMSNCSRIERIERKIPTSNYGEKDIPAYMQCNKVITIDKPGTSGTVNRTPAKLLVKVAATNSLRDELATKAVMKQDFILQVTKRYDERIKQRHREIEEQKKITCVLSKHNRYVREASLEELARTMKSCLTVLDDREEPEEPGLPTLTDEMLREVRSAIAPGPAGEVLAEGFGLRITRKDLYTLADLNWLNDEVINFYMNLLIARGTSSDKYPKVHAMNTFFYPKLLSGGHSSLKRWTRKVDIFAQDLMVVPVHLDIHWCMSIIDFRDKSIIYYDSMGSSNPKCLAALKQYLQDESLDKKKRSYDMSDWKLQSAKKIPQQMNGSDCGVFSCMFAEFICANKKLTFTQDDMPYFRNKMVYEILKGKLL